MRFAYCGNNPIISKHNTHKYNTCDFLLLFLITTQPINPGTIPINVTHLTFNI